MKRAALFILSGVILFSGCSDKQVIIFEPPESIINETSVSEYATVSSTPSSVSATPSSVSVTASDIIIPTTVGETFIDSTGFEWQVLTVEANKALIITAHVHNMGVSYHNQHGFLPFQNAEIANVLNAWFDNDAFVSPEIRAKALPYAFQFDDGTPGGNGVENQATEWTFTPSSTNQQQAITTPGEQGSGDIAFILSISEVHKYFENDISERIAYSISEIGEVGETAYWWLRSPSTHSDYVVWIVGYDGRFYYDPALYTSSRLGFRPAFWVNL